MTTERDDLAEGWYEFITDDGVTSVAYVFESGNLYLPVETLMDEDFMGAARIYRLVRAPRPVTTLEELDALPVGSVVMSLPNPQRIGWQIAYQLWDDGLWHRGCRNADTHPDNFLPATVLHEGTRDE